VLYILSTDEFWYFTVLSKESREQVKQRILMVSVISP